MIINTRIRHHGYSNDSGSGDGSGGGFGNR